MNTYTDSVTSVHWSREDEITIDVDDLRGIMDQIHAIYEGWADKLTWFDTVEPAVYTLTYTT